MSAMLKIIFLSSTSACFELDGQEPWFAPKPYTLRLNGEAAGGGDTNVFSLFRLHPGTEYHLELRFSDGEMEEVRFRTPEERCALDVRAFGALGDGEHDDTAAIQSVISFLPEGGRLYFPPGTEEEAAFREIHEETGLSVRFVPGFRTVDEHSIPGKPGVTKWIIYFLGEYEGQEIRFQKEELLEAPLLSYEEAMARFQFESSRRILKEANDFLLAL